MTRNQIFLGALAGALVLAGLAGAISRDDEHSGSYSVTFSDDDGYSGPKTSVRFNGREYKCRPGETLEFEHDDGRITVVECD